MIEIYGPEGTDERRVADNIAEAFRKQWPDIQDSDDDKVLICANSKIFGYDVQDLDVVVIAKFGGGRWITPKRALQDGDGDSIVIKKLYVNSLALVIEVKGHDQRSVHFDGVVAKVKYRSGTTVEWKDATEQNVKQVHALKKYLYQIGARSLWLAGILVFTNLNKTDFPKSTHNFIARKFSAADLLTTVAEISRPRINPVKRFGSLSSGNLENVEAAINSPIFQTIVPSALDRRQMDQITTEKGIHENWHEVIGKTPLILRGRGGAGKTVILLQLAYHAYSERAARTLFLTYNLALASDVRRTMTLLGIPTSFEAGGIKVETVMSFIGRVLLRFELLPEDTDFFEGYAEALEALSSILDGEKLEPGDLQDLLENDPELFSYDLVMFDEAQDWPLDEIKILRFLYDPNRFVIADGQDQLVRGQYADWKSALQPLEAEVEPLKKCLRMKVNLARFANTLAEQLGVSSWRVGPNTDANGGRVIIIQGEYEDRSIHDEIVSPAALGIVKPIDTLFCVPPGLVEDSDNGDRASLIAKWLEDNGSEVWDGASPNVRRDIPRNENQYRVVQYQSCRGLEGWVVICLRLNEFFDGKLLEAIDNSESSDQAETSFEDEARLYAAQWTMIPICRVMDTLVITLSEEQGPLVDALKACHKKLPDIIEWRK